MIMCSSFNEIFNFFTSVLFSDLSLNVLKFENDDLNCHRRCILEIFSFDLFLLIYLKLLI